MLRGSPGWQRHLLCQSLGASWSHGKAGLVGYQSLQPHKAKAQEISQCGQQGRGWLLRFVGRRDLLLGKVLTDFWAFSLQTSFINSKGAAGTKTLLFLVDFPFSLQLSTFFLVAEGGFEDLGLDQQLLSCCTTFKAVGLLTQHFCRFPVHVLHGAPCMEQLFTAQTLPDWPGGDGVPPAEPCGMLCG